MPKADQKRSFYGWTVVVVGFFVYGFGIGPGYYSWGFFAPEVIAELDLSRQQVGSIFGAFTLTFALAGPLAALAFRRFGVRTTVTLGALLAALGFGLVSRADSVVELYLCYSLIGGIGIGLSSAFAAQTLAVFWFKRYRARAIAIMMLGAAVVGGMVTPVDAIILRLWGWRFAWVLIAGISVLVALISAVFIRDRPEHLGQHPDGREPEEDVSADAEENVPGFEIGAETKTTIAPKWTALEALRTPQFAILTLTSMANIVPWRVLSAHGRLHFEDLGFTTTVAAAILGVRVGVSAVGRLSGSLGDIFSPTKVMAVSLLINGIGLGGLLFADTPTLAYSCVVFLGVGYGAAYISEPVMFAHFFGRNAFVGTSGVRLVVTGIAGFVAPTLAGAAADRTGTYSHTIAVLAVACLVASATIFFCRRPDPPGDSLQDQPRVITM